MRPKKLQVNGSAPHEKNENPSLSLVHKNISTNLDKKSARKTSPLSIDESVINQGHFHFGVNNK